MINDMTVLRAACVSGLAALAVACAGTPEREVPELAQARTTIQQAEEAGAQQYSGAELAAAKDKLARATEAAKDGDEEVAERLAREAALDAELAEAMANTEKSREAVAEVNDSIRTLREELARD